MTHCSTVSVTESSGVFCHEFVPTAPAETCVLYATEHWLFSEPPVIEFVAFASNVYPDGATTVTNDAAPSDSWENCNTNAFAVTDVPALDAGVASLITKLCGRMAASSGVPLSAPVTRQMMPTMFRLEPSGLVNVYVDGSVPAEVMTLRSIVKCVSFPVVDPCVTGEISVHPEHENADVFE